MAIPHAHSGDVVNVHPISERPTQQISSVLIKTEHLEVLRLVMPRGKQIHKHQVPGEITLQCLEGRVTVELEDRSADLAAGELMVLPGHQPHGLRANQDSTVLVTILLVRQGADLGSCQMCGQSVSWSPSSWFGREEPCATPWPSVLVEELNELQGFEQPREGIRASQRGERVPGA